MATLNTLYPHSPEALPSQGMVPAIPVSNPVQEFRHLWCVLQQGMVHDQQESGAALMSPDPKP